MSGSITKSRFHMWRAVLAMAHADNKVTQEEVGFVENYLERIPFSRKQKNILRDDLQNPKKVGDMLSGVINPTDRADFFQFATMLAWSDNDYSIREKDLVDRLTVDQKAKRNEEELLENLRQAKTAGALRRALENEEYKKQAEKVAGLSNVIRYIVPWMEAGDLQSPDEDMFHLWQAIFSLVHADEEVSPEEEKYVDAMVEVFRFTAEQKAIIKEDIKNPRDIFELFDEIKDREYRRQFFVMARTILWCDGFLHELESKAINHIVDKLGDEASEYASELRWIDRKPFMEPDIPKEKAEERMMQDVVAKMITFYKKLSDKSRKDELKREKF